MRRALISAALLSLAAFARPVGAQGTPASPSPEPAGEEVIESFCDECTPAPNLIGGIGGLQAAVEYPASAREARTEGRVVVRFVVDSTGTPADLAIVRSLTPDTDAEALRVIGLARFVPPRQNGQPVAQRMTLPVTFRLSPRITPVRVVAGSAVVVALVTLVGAVLMLFADPFSNQ